MSACYGKNNVTLVVRHHLVVPDEPDDLFRLLLQLCAHHVEVRPLSSGKSGAVSGDVSTFHMSCFIHPDVGVWQMALHPGPSLTSTSVRLRERGQALQYRLTESNVVFFERGTGGAVL